MAESPRTAVRRRAGRVLARGPVARAASAIVAVTATLAVPAALAGAQVVPAANRPAATPAAAVAAVPHFDHVVVVIEENHSETGVVGSPSAPYITSLAAQNANFSQFYAETHPSEPNYLALFSGSTQGLTDDSCPHTYTAPDIASTLIAAGRSFTGYSETMPSAGYTGCGSSTYARKHNPWVNFPAVPAASNQPFTAFPSDYSTLPSLSVVVPNLQDDMHDGTIAQGDTWLSNNLSGYIAWAKTHNSLFVLTFDEDDYTSANRIPTIVAGAQVTPGTYPENVNHYNLLRTLADSFGVSAPGNAATATPITDVFAAPAGDQPPTAAFTSSCTQTACSFDGSASHDPDGSVASWSWDFGDGTTGSGPTPTHSYLAGGSYPVTLTVADDQGVAGSVTHTVTVTGAGSTLASDTFARTVSAGWGSATTGGAYTLTGTASSFAVSGGAGRMSLTAGATRRAVLGSVSSADTDLTVGIGADKIPTGAGVYPGVVGRYVSKGNEYGAGLTISTSRGVGVSLYKIVGGTQASLASSVTVPGLTFTAGTPFTVRLQVTGTNPTTVRARVWAAGAAQPASWTVSATDSTAALQAAGGLGVSSYLPSGATNAPVTTAFSTLSAVSGSGPANQAPAAAFTSSCTQLSCTFDGRDSSDLDGTVASYAWDFGDGSTGTGATPSHAYVTAGAYTVRLTVTDNGGASGAVSHTVSPTAPPAPSPPVAAFTSSCTALSCSVDGTGSSSPSGESITDYAWSFDDGGTGSGATLTHAYAAAGTYSVRLTVTDADGATGTVTHTVTVAASGPAPFVSDSFARTVASGWGSADVGGTWTVANTAANFAVAAGTATVRYPTAGLTQAAYLPATSASSDLTATYAVDKLPVGGPVYPYTIGRRVSTGNEYAARTSFGTAGTVNAWLVRTVGGVETALTTETKVAGLTYAPGTRISVRVQVTGSSPTTVRVRVWAASGVEPTTWNATATDATAALQGSGSIGVRAQLSSKATNAPVTLSVSGVTATAP